MTTVPPQGLTPGRGTTPTTTTSGRLPSGATATRANPVGGEGLGVPGVFSPHAESRRTRPASRQTAVWTDGRSMGSPFPGATAS